MSMESMPSAPKSQEINEAELLVVAERLWNDLPEDERMKISKEEYLEQNREELIKDFLDFTN